MTQEIFEALLEPPTRSYLKYRGAAWSDLDCGVLRAGPARGPHRSAEAALRARTKTIQTRRNSTRNASSPKLSYLLQRRT